MTLCLIRYFYIKESLIKEDNSNLPVNKTIEQDSTFERILVEATSIEDNFSLNTSFQTTLDYSTMSTDINSNCVSPSIEDFPHDLFTQTQRRFGGVIFHFIFAIYLFIAIMRVCDDYFMSSLEIIGQVKFKTF